VKSFNTLIKLKKLEIDNKKIELSKLNQEKDQLHNKLQNLQVELINQQKIAFLDPEILYSYSNYAKDNNDNQLKISGYIADISAKIELVNQEIYEIYAELKKYEVMLDNKKKQLIYEESKRQDLVLDELILQRFGKE